LLLPMPLVGVGRYDHAKKPISTCDPYPGETGRDLELKQIGYEPGNGVGRGTDWSAENVCGYVWHDDRLGYMAQRRWPQTVPAERRPPHKRSLATTLHHRDCPSCHS
jgi:hypothetical protein